MSLLCDTDCIIELWQSYFIRLNSNGEGGCKDYKQTDLEFSRLASWSRNPVWKVLVLRPLSHVSISTLESCLGLNLGLEAPHLLRQNEQLFCLENSKSYVKCQGLCCKYLMVNEPLINADRWTALHVNL